jgi:hypothetical protein
MKYAWIAAVTKLCDAIAAHPCEIAQRCCPLNHGSARAAEP